VTAYHMCTVTVMSNWCWLALPATAAGGASSGQTSHADVSTQGGLLSWVMWAPTVLCDMAAVPQIWWPQVHDHATLFHKAQDVFLKGLVHIRS